MVWTEITRRQYRREGLRYESDTMDAECFVMEPLLPPASALGRPRETDMRAVVNAILYIASTGCQWRQLPKDFPPYSTVQGYFYAWSRDGTFASLNHALVMASREAAGDGESRQLSHRGRPASLRRSQWIPDAGDRSRRHQSRHPHPRRDLPACRWLQALEGLCDALA